MTVSLSTLRAELTGLELRLVDRLNSALAGKADAGALTELTALSTANSARISILEQNAVVKDSPAIARLDAIEDDMRGLKAVAGYKKWLWAQTIALAGIAIAIIALIAAQQGSVG